ncbi:MAG: glycosyl hydrolase [Fimbriimonadales bacterium]|nr:MAG: glycosyl hydrolase [Fimbriimonadales bacterium]
MNTFGMHISARPIAFLMGMFTLLVGVAIALQHANHLSEQETKDGWKLLFDGQSLKGWTVAGAAESWTVDDGTLHCTGKGGGMIYADGVYRNFELKLDFKVSPKGNSGVFLRTWDKNDPVQTGIEVQVLDSYGKEKPSKHDCGAIYDIQAPSKNAVKPAGEWNSYHITVKESQIVVFLNGEKVNEVDLTRWTEPNRNPDGTPNKFKYAYNTMTRPGYIALQNHGNPIWYRNIKVKPLD